MVIYALFSTLGWNTSNYSLFGFTVGEQQFEDFCIPFDFIKHFWEQIADSHLSNNGLHFSPLTDFDPRT